MNGYIIAAILIVLVCALGLLTLRRGLLRRASVQKHSSDPLSSETKTETAALPNAEAVVLPPSATAAAVHPTLTTDAEIAVVAAAAQAPVSEFKTDKKDEPRSQLLAHVTVEASPDDPDRGEAFIVWAKARILEDHRPRRLRREVSLTIRGPDDMDYPAQTTNAAWQRPGRKDFYYLGESYKPKREDLESHDWLAVLRIPVNHLEMPRQGRCQLRALVSWRDRSTQLTIARGIGICVFDVVSEGLLDRQEMQTEPDWLVARVIGMALHQTGAPAPAAMKEVEKWLEIRTLTSVNQKGAQRHRRERLYQVIAEHGGLPPAERTAAAREACGKLVRTLKNSDRTELYGLFQRVAAGNGQPDAPEVTSLAEWLGVNPAGEAR